jgi:MtN3 and saliva related transmembrane protein
MSIENVTGIMAGVLTTASLLPQLIKLIREKKGDDISAGMFIILLLGLSGWIAYGVMKKDYPIIITNSVSFLLNSMILVFTFKYKKNPMNKD